MKPGIYYDIPFADYLKIDAFSKSMVPHILKSPKHLRHVIDNGELESTKIMDFGSLVDCLLMEPQEYDKRFFMLPETYINSQKKEMPFNMNSTTCKELFFGAKAKGLIPIKSEDIGRAQTIISEIKKHRTASQWIGGKPQVTIIWIDPETKVLCKGRIDIYIDGQREIDLKVTDDPHPSRFSRTCTALKYHVQAAMYSIGLYCAEAGKYPEDWQMPFSFIAAESQQPHDVVTYDMDTESLDAGKVVFQDAVRLYADCLEKNEWPGYSQFAESLSIQQWAIHKILYEGATDE